MDKRKIFSALSVLGVLFLIALVIGYTRLIDTRGVLVENRVEVPDLVKKEFYKVTSRVRTGPMNDITFTAPDGGKVRWKDFDGDYLLVNFWASWCAPCVVELPSLDKLQQKYAGKGLEVIAISLDRGRSHDEIRRYLENRNIGQFAAYWDEMEQVERNIVINGLPTTYLLDPAGRVLNIFEGDANWDSIYFTDFFDAVISR